MKAELPDISKKSVILEHHLVFVCLLLMEVVQMKLPDETAELFEAEMPGDDDIFHFLFVLDKDPGAFVIPGDNLPILRILRYNTDTSRMEKSLRRNLVLPYSAIF